MEGAADGPSAVSASRPVGYSAAAQEECKEETDMPVQRSKDGKGPYYRWGNSGKKYHYEPGNKQSRDAAKKKAERQGRAARASGYQG